MLPFKRTFEGEKQHLQQLNGRLAQYLCRTKQLEQDNAHLVSEINKLRQAKTGGWEPRYKAEMRDLRGMLGQLSMEKSQAELEREKLWRELQMVQGLCSEQTEVCRDISGDLKGCEKELHLAHQTNSGLQQRLFQLESQCKSMEEAHRQEKERLRRQVDSRVVPILTQTYRGPPVASVEEVQEYTRGLSEGWMETFDMYQQKVEEMEQSIRADQAKLGDLQREKMLYAAEMDKLRTEAEKKGHAQLRLEEQLMHMREKIHVDSGEYQVRTRRERAGHITSIMIQKRPDCFKVYIYHEAPKYTFYKKKTQIIFYLSHWAKGAATPSCLPHPLTQLLQWLRIYRGSISLFSMILNQG